MEPLTPVQSVSPTLPDRGSSTSRVGAMFENGLALMAGSAVGNGANYLFMLFLARQLGAEDFGLYALGVTLFNTVVLLATAGLDAAAVKFPAERYAQQDAAAAQRIVSAVLTGALVSGVLGGVGLWLAADGLAVGLYGKPGLSPALWWFAAAVPSALLTSLALSLLQGHHIVRDTVLIKYLWEPLGRWILAGVALWAGWGLVGVVGGLFATSLISALFALIAALRASKLKIGDAWRAEAQEIRALAMYCAPLLASNLFGIVAPRTDLLVLGYWASSPDVGIYLAASQTAAVLALVLGAFDVAFAPIMSQAWARQDEGTLRDGYTAVHRMATTVATPLAALLLVFGNEIMGLFGAGFAAGAPLLAIFACGHLLNCATGSANTVLLMTGRSHLVLVNTMLYGIVLIAGTLWLIPIWGTTGAAAAAAACFAGLNGMRLWQVRRLHGMMPWTRGLFKAWIAGAAMSLLLWTAKPFVGLLFVAPLALLGVGLYGAILYLAHIDYDDRLMLASTWNKVRLAWN